MADEEQPQKPLKSGQGLLQGFGGLDGIEPPRDVHVRDNSTIERMLDVSFDFFKKYDYPLPSSFPYGYRDPGVIYHETYQQVKSLINFDFGEEDFKEFIFALSNREMEEREAKAWGMYTGCLLHLFTERARELGKRAIVHIDGKDNKFDYLFNYAGAVDVLIVENFRGNHICSNIGAYDSNAAGVVFGRNLKGDDALSDIGAYSGFVDKVFAFNITCNNALNCIGKHGLANQIIAMGIKGEYPLRSSGMDVGKVHQLISVDVNGYHAISGIGAHAGRINQIIMFNITGEDVLDGAAWNNGRIHQLICVNCNHFSSNFPEPRRDPCCYDEFIKHYVEPKGNIPEDNRHKDNILEEIGNVVTNQSHSSVPSNGDSLGKRVIDVPSSRKSVIDIFPLIMDLRNLRNSELTNPKINLSEYAQLVGIADKFYTLKPKEPVWFNAKEKWWEVRN